MELCINLDQVNLKQLQKLSKDMQTDHAIVKHFVNLKVVVNQISHFEKKKVLIWS